MEDGNGQRRGSGRAHAPGTRGTLETEVLEVFCGRGGALAVNDVLTTLNHQRVNPLPYTAVLTVLAQLTEAEVLQRHLRGNGYVYQVAVPGDSSTADPELLHRLISFLEDEA